MDGEWPIVSPCPASPPSRRHPQNGLNRMELPELRLTKDWFFDMVEPCRLEIEVVLDMASSLLLP